MTDIYRDPNGLWVSEARAFCALRRLERDLALIECHDRASYIRRSWRAVAARPNQWRELRQFADAHLAKLPVEERETARERAQRLQGEHDSQHYSPNVASDGSVACDPRCNEETHELRM